MIRALRIRHRRMIVLLAVIVPVLFALGLLARQKMPSMEQVPGGVDSTIPAGFERLSSSDDAWDGLAIRTTWSGRQAPPGLAVTLEVLVDPQRPDLLVYWTAGRPGAQGLPGDALLLGRIGDRRTASWVLPGDASRGSLILYSLAAQQVVAIAALPPAGDARGSAGP